MQYNMNKDWYSIRYFFPNQSLEDTLKEVRKFAKGHKVFQVNIFAANVMDREDKWGASVIYFGGTNAEA